MILINDLATDSLFFIILEFEVVNSNYWRRMSELKLLENEEKSKPESRVTESFFKVFDISAMTC